MPFTFDSSTRVALPADELVTAMCTPAEQEEAALYSGATRAQATIIEELDAVIRIELYTESPARRGGGTDRSTLHIRWDRTARTCDWTREDHNHGDRVRTTGRIRIEPAGADACTFHERGEIDVAYPLIGKRIAKKLAAAIERKAPDRCRYWEERLAPR